MTPITQLNTRKKILGLTTLLFCPFATIQAADFPAFYDESATIIERFSLPKSNSFYYLVLEEPKYEEDFYRHVLYRFRNEDAQNQTQFEENNFDAVVTFKLSPGYSDQFSSQFAADEINDRLVISLKPITGNLHDFKQEWYLKGNLNPLDALTLNGNAFGTFSEIRYNVQKEPDSLCFTLNYIDGYGSTDVCLNKKTIPENYLVSKQTELKEKRFLDTVTPLKAHRYECKEDDGGCISVTYEWQSPNHLTISDFYPGGETLYEFFTQDNGITQTISSSFPD